MIEQLNKLIEFLGIDKEKEPEGIYSTMGIVLVDEDEIIEFDVDSELKVDLKGDWLFVNASQYIGVININRIEQITEI